MTTILQKVIKMIESWELEESGISPQQNETKKTEFEIKECLYDGAYFVCKNCGDITCAHTALYECRDVTILRRDANGYRYVEKRKIENLQWFLGRYKTCASCGLEGRINILTSSINNFPFSE